VSAKQSLNLTSSVRWGVSIPPSPNHGKTLNHVARNRDISGNGYVLSDSTKSFTEGRRKRPGCNTSEHRGSLVKIMAEMDEILFEDRSQYRLSERKSGINGISGVLVMTRSEREFRNLGSLRLPGINRPRAGSSYKETKWEWSNQGGGWDRSTDAYQLIGWMIVQHNAIVGKGLCWAILTKEKKEHVLRKLSNILNSGNFEGFSVNSKFTYIAQESRMRENLTYGLTRGQGKQGQRATAPLSYSTARWVMRRVEKSE